VDGELASINEVNLYTDLDLLHESTTLMRIFL